MFKLLQLPNRVSNGLYRDAAAAVSEVSGDVETEGKKTSEEINGGRSDSKWKPERKLTKEQEARKKEREEYKQKKLEEEEQVTVLFIQHVDKQNRLFF